MIRTLKNISTGTLVLSDFHGLELAVNETTDGLQFGENELRNSIAIAHACLHNEMTISDGLNTFTGMPALDFIRGTSNQVTPDGKPLVTSSDRPKDTFRYYTSYGDNFTTGKIGEGNQLLFNVTANSQASVDVAFIEDVWVKDGTVHYSGVSDSHSELDVDIVVPAGIPFPAPGNNTGNYDFDGTNWIPNANNTGMYFILATETTIARYINGYPLTPGGWHGDITAPEPQKLPSPYIVRVTVYNNGNAALLATVILGTYRAHTIN